MRGVRLTISPVIYDQLFAEFGENTRDVIESFISQQWALYKVEKAERLHRGQTP